MLNKEVSQEYIKILKEELVPAMGCTEPIALACAAAKGRKELGENPEKIVAKCSGNIIKNVKCVTIPNSGGLTGIESACLLGAIAGNPEAGMEVLENVTNEKKNQIRQLLDEKCCTVEFLDSEIPLHFIIILSTSTHQVEVEVRHTHTNIVSIKKDGVSVYENQEKLQREGHTTDRTKLSLENIKIFADEIELEEIYSLYEKQIRCNMDIAYEGISGDYGLGIGRVIQESYADGVVTRMKAFTAAASEARMAGCDMPVVINSGSGNQGIASSVPVIVYAREKNIPSQQLYRALVFSSLLTIYQKEFIGKLSAFCGAVSASCASAAAITYMVGGDMNQIKATIDNTLANIPGIICDGAKISCAAKIATSVDASMMAHHLAMQNKEYEAFTGILKEDTGETISCVGYIGKVGMHQTDKEIIKIMLE